MLLQFSRHFVQTDENLLVVTLLLLQKCVFSLYVLGCTRSDELCAWETGKEVCRTTPIWFGQELRGLNIHRTPHFCALSGRWSNHGIAQVRARQGLRRHTLPVNQSGSGSGPNRCKNDRTRTNGWLMGTATKLPSSSQLDAKHGEDLWGLYCG